MAELKRLLALALIVVGLLAAGCGPEASRARSGGPGADVGNRGQPVDMHGLTDPSYKEPQSGQAVKVEQSAKK